MDENKSTTVDKKKFILAGVVGAVIMAVLIIAAMFLLKGCGGGKQTSGQNTTGSQYGSEVGSQYDSESGGSIGSNSQDSTADGNSDTNGTENGTGNNTENSLGNNTESGSLNQSGQQSLQNQVIASNVGVEFKTGNSWDSNGKKYIIYEAVISNNSNEDIKNWKLILEVKNGLEISQYWNCKVNKITYQGKEAIEITPESYNGSITKNSKLNGIGIIAAATGGYTINGCVVEANGTSAEIAGGNQVADNNNNTSNGGQTNDSSSGSSGSSSGGSSPNGGSSSGGSSSSDNSSSSGGSSSGSSNPPAVYGGLHVSGTKLLDAKGNQVQLKGVSTHGLAWFPDYVNKEAFKTLRDDWGANVVRLAMYSAEYGGYCSGGNKENLKNLIHKGVTAATELNMYVIIDWHILSDGNPNTNKSEAIKFFDEMSAKYDSYNNVIYEICNEPNGADWNSQIKPYAQDVISTIRKNDNDALILVGTNTWSQDVDAVIGNELSDHNVMYTLHFYAATHKDNIRNKLTTALNAGIPVFVSECSICDASGNGGIDYNSANTWLDLMNKNKISFIGWSLCNKAETSAVIKSSCNKLSGWTQDDLTDAGKWFRTAIRGN